MRADGEAHHATVPGGGLNYASQHVVQTITQNHAEVWAMHLDTTHFLLLTGIAGADLCDLNQADFAK